MPTITALSRLVLPGPRVVEPGESAEVDADAAERFVRLGAAEVKKASPARRRKPA